MTKTKKEIKYMLRFNEKTNRVYYTKGDQIYYLDGKYILYEKIIKVDTPSWDILGLSEEKIHSEPLHIKIPDNNNPVGCDIKTHKKTFINGIMSEKN